MISKRDARVTMEYLHGRTLADLAMDLGISSQRVHQIVQHTLIQVGHRINSGGTSYCPRWSAYIPGAQLDLANTGARIRSFRSHNYSCNTPEYFYYHEIMGR